MFRKQEQETNVLAKYLYISTAYRTQSFICN